MEETEMNEGAKKNLRRSWEIAWKEFRKEWE